MKIASLRTCLITASLLFLVIAPRAYADPRWKMRPGIGPRPAFTCLTTTITETGNTYMSKVIRSSGNLQSDNAALKLARRLKFTNPDHHRYTGGEREVTLLVQSYRGGRAGWRSYAAGEELPKICSTPADTDKA